MKYEFTWNDGNTSCEIHGESMKTALRNFADELDYDIEDLEVRLIEGEPAPVEFNKELMEKRLEALKNELRAQGIDPDAILKHIAETR
jgi:hypothetical protein